MRSSYPYLIHAPITEAVLDLHVDLPPTVTLATLGGLASRLGAEFPDVRPIHRLQANLDLTEGGVASGSSETIGNIYWNTDKSMAVQVRLAGFAVNHVRSYAGWENFRRRAEVLWAHYCDLAQPRKILRCALRYINKLPLPADRELSTQLRTRPEVSADLPQRLEGYFMRLALPFEDGRKAVITQATEDALEGTDQRHLILDIDVSVERDLDPGSGTVWDELESLREIKNRCFFSSLEKSAWEGYR
ncbi:MAG TPA: TIGR04255 family protein [Candidatus Nanopelagicales bacterium]|nr:TIGR04255 family protein [Candidatus Nanopelagicales bacterium]